jgi:hypothetical protein
MVHLRIVVPADRSGKVVSLLEATPSACNLIFLAEAARQPPGDVILCDVAREDASVVIDDLRELGVPEVGSIALEQIDSQISRVARRAERAARGTPSDAVVWEEVEARTSESSELGGNFLVFMMLACLIASVGIFTGSPILIVGAMVVGPEFGPLAGLCVAVVERRRGPALRSLTALTAGFPVGNHRRLPLHADLRGDRPGRLGLQEHRQPADPVHRRAGRLLDHRRLLRRGGGMPLADRLPSRGR